MFARLGSLVVRHPWLTIGAWLVIVFAVVATAPKLTSTTDQSAFLPNRFESIQAAQLQQQAFPNNAAPGALVVFERGDGAPLNDGDVATVGAIATQLNDAHLPNVTAVAAGKPSDNRLIQVAGVQLAKDTGVGDARQRDAINALRDALGPKVSGTALKAGVTGPAASSLDAQKSASKGLAVIGIATITLILVLLLVIFRSPVIALLPIIVVGAIYAMVNGLVAMVNKAFDLKIDSSVTSMLVVVLFGIGTDYILFLMFRYRERLRAGEDPKTAMVSAVTRVGEAITSAAAAVIIAFLALTLSTFGLFRSLGPALAIAIAVTLLTGLTVVPALGSLLGTKVFWPSKAWRHEPKGAVFARIGGALGRRPAVFAAISGGLLVVLGLFALGFNPTFDLTSGSTSNAAESVVYSKEMLKGLPAGAARPSDVLLRSQTRLNPDQLNAFRGALAGVDGVGQVSEPLLSPDNLVADFRVTLKSAAESDAALATVRGPLRDAARAAAPPGTTALIGGATAVFVDFRDAMNHDYALVFPVAAVLIMVVLGLLLRSLVAPWYLMLSVLLGFVATLGAAVLVFQQLRHEVGVVFTLPVIMYLFVVALGTDYNILMVARLREEARSGHEPKQAAALAVRHTGPTIAAAGLVLAGTFASMTLAGNIALSEMGFAISVGIAISAFVMALFWTPALTALIGRRAWWPGRGAIAPAPTRFERMTAAVSRRGR
ncbi:MMPL family transporter [Nocardia arthritidis]|uniref:MMPL family transporter n=1 Tax=Nocardia arthritidis TaxID=228602 RepID=A0A6G9Y9V4_9NOCA|nr:MMPL family transporter [Nocardia arthritidis]QIS10002.1 MMPL family transporter [Nocardia arthritidis]